MSLEIYEGENCIPVRFEVLTLEQLELTTPGLFYGLTLDPEIYLKIDLSKYCFGECRLSEILLKFPEIVFSTNVEIERIIIPPSRRNILTEIPYDKLAELLSAKDFQIIKMKAGNDFYENTKIPKNFKTKFKIEDFEGVNSFVFENLIEYVNTGLAWVNYLALENKDWIKHTKFPRIFESIFMTCEEIQNYLAGIE